MATPNPKDVAAKTRIINHLNADHQRELSHYLQHWAKLSARAAYKPHLRDVTFETMSIQSSNGVVHIIPIKPPMTSWADARTRAVDMDREARAALAISDIQVKEFVWPNAAQTVIAAVLIYYYISYSLAGYIVPGSLFYDKILQVFPGGPEMYLWLQKVIMGPVILLHVAETAWMEGWKLRKFGVHRGSALWWKWIVSTLLEGFGAHQRFDVLVARLAKEKELKKH